MRLVTLPVIAFVALLCIACSSPAPVAPTPAPAPAPAPTPTPVTPPLAPTWDQVAAVIQANCAKCHDGTTEPAFTSGVVFHASPAAALLTSGAMPLPPNTISAADKATLLAYLAEPVGS